MSDLDPEYKIRLKLVYNYIKQFTELNTYFLHEYVVGGSESDLKFMHSATSIVLSTLASIYTLPGALVMWGALWEDVQNDLNQLCADAAYVEDIPSGTEALRCVYNDEYLERYQSEADNILLEVGIL
jgi:hypothetical protein